MRLKRKKRIQETVELNITAFLNLMVILVPFLLITAVFSRITVLELNLPALQQQQADNQAITLQLELVISSQALVVQDTNLGTLKTIAMNEQGDINGPLLKKVLIDIKTRFPDETAITLVVHPDVPYSTLISIIDQVSYAEVVNVTSLETVELFPDVSISDAVPEFADNNLTAEQQP